jgi:Zn-dependent protease
MLAGKLNPVAMAIYALAFLLALTVHEYAHARAAFSAGDDTAKKAGRLSLNPLVHLDVAGTILFVITLIAGFGIAWGKPVPVNHLKMRNPRWDSLKISLWGPLSNILLAIALSVALWFVKASMVGAVIYICILFNLTIAFFNLIPIAPLDGSHILAALLPQKAAQKYAFIMSKYGLIILAAAIFVPLGGQTLVTRLIRLPIDALSRLVIQLL